MRLITSSLLLALTSGLAISALPTSASSLRTRADDLTARAPLEPFEKAEEASELAAAEAAEEAEDIAYLNRRDLELLAARQATKPDDELLADELAEEAEDEDYLRKRDAVLELMRRDEKRALKAFEAEEEQEEAATLKAEEAAHESDLAKRVAQKSDNELLADEIAEEIEDEENLRKRDLQIAAENRAVGGTKALKAFEAEEEEEEAATLAAEEAAHESDLTKREAQKSKNELLADEIAAEIEEDES